VEDEELGLYRAQFLVSRPFAEP